MIVLSTLSVAMFTQSRIVEILMNDEKESMKNELIVANSVVPSQHWFGETEEKHETVIRLLDASVAIATEHITKKKVRSFKF
jgi:hypothetical protein